MDRQRNRNCFCNPRYGHVRIALVTIIAASVFFFLQLASSLLITSLQGRTVFCARWSPYLALKN